MKKETSMTTIVGFTLREVRTDKKMTQSEIAKHLGMTNAGWGKIENGKTSLSLEKMLCACKLMGISPVKLLEDSYNQMELLVHEGWVVHENRIDDDGLISGILLTNSLDAISNNRRIPAPLLPEGKIDLSRSSGQPLGKSPEQQKMGTIINKALRGFYTGEYLANGNTGSRQG